MDFRLWLESEKGKIASQIRKEGALARKNGLTLKDNPYHIHNLPDKTHRNWTERDQLKSSAWSAGWTFPDKFGECVLEMRQAGEVTAYHCGPQIRDFSTGHIGGGEGSQILGPGIYFATAKSVARMYCKYAGEPYLHEVILDTTNFYNPIQGTPHLYPALDKIAVELGYRDRDDLYEKVKGVSTLGHGRGFIGALVKILGNNKARDILVKHGIQGASEIIDYENNITEFSVFDPTVIRKVSSTPAK
jgi:hypothetical protein